ncbi:MAG: hypothetical protein ACYS76_02755 [Planctomycetota bacterium]|jgi:hypothetical protein
MAVTLDGERFFDEQDLQIQRGSFSRDSVEKAVPGLDGVLSIDLGMRSRKIRQAGVLRAGSQSQVRERVSAVSACMDGDTHTLATGSGEEFHNLRMDSFETKNERASGGGAALDYEILYTQLMV